MPFVFNQHTTYDTKGAVRVYIKQCGDGKYLSYVLYRVKCFFYVMSIGLDKKQFTAGLTLRAVPSQHVTWNWKKNKRDRKNAASISTSCHVATKK